MQESELTHNFRDDSAVLDASGDFSSNFCASPWLHMRINNQGHYEYCRWAVKKDRLAFANIKQIAPIQWFQKEMSAIRKGMLQGEALPGCAECREMETHGKVSGRQRQLLKVGVRPENFASGMHSTPWLTHFQHSWLSDGDTDLAPQDWQIDLGNYCNSACLFCSPFSSSRLASEHRQLGLISDMPPRAWCDDEQLLEKFLHDLQRIPHLAYLHFIGGETMITPAFAKILDVLIDTGKSDTVTIGFTTNLTTWNDDIVARLCQFGSVNLGVSIEALDPINDYVRYGSDITHVRQILMRWIEQRNRQGWLMQMRITPTILTVGHIRGIYDFAVKHNIAVESCNFLTEPKFMRPSVLPPRMRLNAIERLAGFLQTDNIADKIINTRDPSHSHDQCQQDAKSYMNYLQNAPDESHRLPDLVRYLKQMESLHRNCILDYAPEYEELFRSAGY